MKMYMCPVCEKKYANYNKAEECRKQCLQEDYPVATVYFCTHCDKEYSSEEEAEDCVLTCGPELIEFVDDDAIIGTCETCRFTDKWGGRLFPCPYIYSDGVHSCAEYTPDINEFGTGIETEWRYMQQARGVYGNS